MRSLDRLQSRLSQLERSQSELASGRRIQKPSDDPTGARRAMSLRSAQQAREQDLRNADDAMGWLGSADGQLQSASSLLARARELATRGASDANPAERGALAMEVRSIAEEMATIANTRRLDRPLFGGFTGGAAVERDAAGAWTSNGDGDAITRRLSDSGATDGGGLVRVNITADEWLGPNAQLLTELDELADAIETKSSSEISGQLSVLDAAGRRIGDGLGQIGAATNRVTAAKARAEDLSLTLRKELSDVQDIDMAKGVMELQVQDVAFEATLQAIGRSLPPSLGAFLR